MKSQIFLIIGIFLGLLLITFSTALPANVYNNSGTLIVYDCTTLNETGVYQLNQSITTTGTCFIISMSHGILNGAGYTITGDGDSSSDLGISMGGNNNTIANLSITNFGKGVECDGCGNVDSTLINLKIFGNALRGFNFAQARNILIKDTTIFSNTVDFLLSSTSSNNTCLNCTYNGTETVTTTSSWLIRKWYLDVNVTDSLKIPLGNANVSAYSNSDSLELTENTSTAGLLERKSLTEYIHQGSGYNYYSNYSINFTRTGFESYSTNLNVSRNSVITLSLNDTIAPTLTIDSPENASTSTSSSIIFNLTSSENSTVILALGNGTNFSMSTADNLTFTKNITYFVDGNYNATFFINDSYGNQNNTKIVFFTIDTTSPQVTINSPTNGTTFSTSSATLNITLSETGNIILALGNGTNFSMSSTDNLTFTKSFSNLNNGDYASRFYVNDSYGNQNNSQTVSFTINVPEEESTTTTSSSGGGGGGSSGSPTSSVSITQEPTISSVKGENSGIEFGNEYKINLGSTTNSILKMIAEMKQGKVFVNYSLDGINYTTILELDNDVEVKLGSTHTLFFSLESFNETHANITVQKLPNSYITSSAIVDTGDYKSENKIIIYFIIGVILLVVILKVIFLLKK